MSACLNVLLRDTVLLQLRRAKILARPHATAPDFVVITDVTLTTGLRVLATERTIHVDNVAGYLDARF